MTNADDDPNDRDLKTKFRALRQSQERNTPTFRSVVAHDARSTRRSHEVSLRHLWRPTLALGTALALSLWLVARNDRSLEVEPWVVGQWVMPTDVLLDLSTVPGNHLLYELPEIGNHPIGAPDGAMYSSSNRRFSA